MIQTLASPGKAFHKRDKLTFCVGHEESSLQFGAINNNLVVIASKEG